MRWELLWDLDEELAVFCWELRESGSGAGERLGSHWIGWIGCLGAGLNFPRLCVKLDELLFQRHKGVAARGTPAYASPRYSHKEA